MKDKNPTNISFKNSKPYSKQFDDIYYSYGDGVEETTSVPTIHPWSMLP